MSKEIKVMFKPLLATQVHNGFDETHYRNQGKTFIGIRLPPKGIRIPELGYTFLNWRFIMDDFTVNLPDELFTM